MANRVAPDNTVDSNVNCVIICTQKIGDNNVYRYN